MRESSRRITRGACFLLAVSAVLPHLLASATPAKAPTAVRLFHIENSHSPSHVAYDARVGTDGRFDTRRPVEAYWLLFSQDGRRQKLSWVEKRFAYGFKTRFAGEDTVVMKMTAGVDREITIDLLDGVARATVEIDGHLSVLNRIYVRSVGPKIWPSVEYLDVFGRDVETGDERYERISF